MDSWRSEGVVQRLDDLGVWAWVATGVAVIGVALAFVVRTRSRSCRRRRHRRLPPGLTPYAVLDGPDGPAP